MPNISLKLTVFNSQNSLLDKKGPSFGVRKVGLKVPLESSKDHRFSKPQKYM